MRGVAVGADEGREGEGGEEQVEEEAEEEEDGGEEKKGEVGEREKMEEAEDSEERCADGGVGVRGRMQRRGWTIGAEVQTTQCLGEEK